MAVKRVKAVGGYFFGDETFSFCGLQTDGRKIAIGSRTSNGDYNIHAMDLFVMCVLFYQLHGKGRSIQSVNMDVLQQIIYIFHSLF